MDGTLDRPTAPRVATDGADGSPRARREAAGLLEAVGVRKARPRWPVAVAGIVVGATVALIVASSLGGDGDDEVSATAVELTTVEAATADMVVTVDYDGTLEYGDERQVAASIDGTVTAAVAPGQTVERGDVLAVIDATPVVVLYGSTPMWRELAAEDTGTDVTLLEENLVALGLDPDGTITVDEAFTWRTEQAVFAWQEELGLEQTGTVPAPAVVVVPGPTVVTDIAAVGEGLRSGESLASLVDAGVQRVVVETPASELDAFTAGDPVTVEVPDGTTIASVVFSVATAAEATAENAGGDSGEASIEVLILLGEPAPDSYREGPVTVQVIEEESAAATVVPTRALVALAEGGLAVEVAQPDGTGQLVRVETGIYQDGLVEITNGAVEPGTDMVVPG